MKLMYHPVSPYSRKVYMLARELGLDDQITLEKVVVAPVHYPGWSDNVKDVAPFNPLTKIPTLVLHNGVAIFDSKVICEYFESHGSDEATVARSRDGVEDMMKWRRKVIHACADGICDAQVLLVYENKVRAEQGLRYQAWVDGQTEKTNRGCDFLEREVAVCLLRNENDKPTGIAEVAVAAFLAFLDAVGFAWRETRPKLTDWLKHWEKRESFKRTTAEVDWKTGDWIDVGFKPF